MDRQALIFLHIPKTAGTTLNRIIEWQYNPRLIFTMDPYRIRATADRLRTLSEDRRRRLQVVRGHLYYGIHDCLPQGATYITMLRDPVKRTLSSYYFIQRRPLHPMHRKVTSERVSVEDFIRLTPHRQNLQCKMIAGLKGDAPCDEATLEKAKEHLTRSFSVVGICERFEESLVVIARTFDWEIPYYESRKVAKSRPQVESSATEMIREHNQYDLALYEFGQKLFEESVQKMAAVVTEGLVELKMKKKPSSWQNFRQSTLGTGRFLVSKIASAT